jgi:hypothetical protein
MSHFPDLVGDVEKSRWSYCSVEWGSKFVVLSAILVCLNKHHLLLDTCCQFVRRCIVIANSHSLISDVLGRAVTKVIDTPLNFSTGERE